MADKPQVFAEAARVLRPGGRLVVCAWLADPDASRLARRYLLRGIREEGRLASLDSCEHYTQWIEGAGFEDVRFEDWSVRVARPWTVSARRVLRALFRASTWRYLRDSGRTERRFLLTVLRMMAGYRVGAVRYGIFTATNGRRSRSVDRGSRGG
jgi:tocopherol O-methyltransferase